MLPNPIRTITRKMNFKSRTFLIIIVPFKIEISTYHKVGTCSVEYPATAPGRQRIPNLITHPRLPRRAPAKDLIKRVQQALISGSLLSVRHGPELNPARARRVSWQRLDFGDRAWPQGLGVL